MVFKHKTFWIHLGLSILCLTGIVFLIHVGISLYTDHNITFTVPDLKGMKTSEVKKKLPHPSIELLITDSVYDPEKDPGIVIRQEPFPGEKLKKNRKIYVITTTSLPPRVPMPKLTDLSVRQAKIILLSYGLKCGTISEQPADCNGCIVEQVYKGKPIKPGTPIEKESVIHLTVGTKKFFHSLDTTLTTDSI